LAKSRAQNAVANADAKIAAANARAAADIAGANARADRIQYESDAASIKSTGAMSHIVDTDTESEKGFTTEEESDSDAGQ
jgi:hypothetical protein